MPNQLIDVPYYRERAVAYANYWAYRRNPKFYSFDEIGGDCTNFISQALYAANDVMNFTPTYGWYYRDLNDRAPAWTSVVYLFQFLTTNKGAGPYGHEIPLGKIQRGDVIQLLFTEEDFEHSVIVTSIKGSPTPDSIFVASHSSNANCRPLSTFEYVRLRAIHIDGVRHPRQTNDML